MIRFNPEEFTNGQHGSITGYFSTFDHDHGDSYGQVVKRGAFAGTIARRKATGHPFALLLNHNWNIIIGRVVDIGEDDKGAYFTAEYFPTEKAQEVRCIVESGVLWQFSMEYSVIDYGRIRAKDGNKVTELRELELYEISIVLHPANPHAKIINR